MNYLLLVPVYNVAHILPHFFKSIKSLNPKPDYIIFCENNSSDETLAMCQSFKDIPSELLTLSFDRDHVQRFGVYDAIAQVRQKQWERARELDPQFVLTVDSDILIDTPEALEILSYWGSDIVSASVPCLSGCLNAAWLRSDGLFDRKTLLMKKTWLEINSLLTAEINLPSLLSLDKTPSVVGAACVLYSNRFLQDKRVNWYPFGSYFSDGRIIPEDASFFLAARQFGYQSCLDRFVRIRHIVWDSKRLVKPWTKMFEPSLDNFPNKDKEFFF